MEAYIRSNAAHEIYKLDGEVPETVMPGEISDISQFSELPYITKHKGLWSISLHMHFSHTSIFLESQTGSKSSGNFFN